MAIDNLWQEKIQKMSTIDWPSEQQHTHQSWCCRVDGNSIMVPAAAAMQQAVVAMTTVNLPAEKIKVYFDKPQSTSYKRNIAFMNSATQAEDTHNRGIKIFKQQQSISCDAQSQWCRLGSNSTTVHADDCHAVAEQ